jgi:hypothetical protein
MNDDTLPSGRPSHGWSGTYTVNTQGSARLYEEELLEKQLAALDQEPGVPVSTALRWGTAQLDIIRQAARLAGVPYQTYLKMAAIRQALADLQTARAAGIDVPEAAERVSGAETTSHQRLIETLNRAAQDQR